MHSFSAATTFDITRLIGQTNRMTEKICLISLLQPPPETVALFDEIILISDGLIIYSGPVDQVENHFNSLGYSIPERMDLADWLQSVPTQDGAQWLRHSGDDEGETPKHLTPEEFQERFEESKLGQEILEKLNAPNNSKHDENLVSMTKKKYANPWYKSLELLVRREALLWWRDKYAIKAKIVQTILMGTIVGTVFFQQKDPRTILSALFQSMFYTIIGAMILVRNQFFDRPVFYKQQDAKFFPSWSYVLGCSIASIPNALFDALGYGTFIFWLVGLSYTEGASAANYFIFLLLLFVTSLSAGLVFGIFSTAVQNITTSQACMAILSLLCVLFSGFTVQPDVIPNYYIWLYWLNPFAWLLRGLVVNQFESGQFDEASSEPGLTDGELVLVRFGFTLDDEPYTFEWVWWGILFAVACALLAMIVSTFMLNHVRFATGLALDDDSGNIEETLQEDGEMKALNLPFSRGVLTFKNMHYSVTSSITKETMELLKGIDGVLEAGKMTALMGSSGAGKSTLMDVLALRKTSGTIEGDVRLNGHPIDPSSFRRCTGYVEQFDVQSAQLTIKETLKFSARLRLDERTVSKEDRDKFVAETLAILELTDIQHLQVGSDDSGGLSFEQRKRLSIANELVANPTIIFADEPTSGLDSRSAAVIMRGLKRIASSGRTVCATIHQPSIAIFNEFDSLLLLKRGGEVVYHGAIGKDACCLIEYFERYEGTPKILPGENPATWMLKVTGAGSATGTKKLYDYAGSYSVSKLRERCLARIDEISAGASEEERIVYERKYATSAITQYLTVFKKGWVVYFRSPSYNTVRMTVSGVIALLFASVYASQRIPTNESDLISRINSIFISVLFMCVNAQNTVLGIFENERNMFYRHKSANMYGSTPILVAYTLAELPFILLTGAVFSVLFYFIMGFEQAAGPFFSFFMFVTLGIATFTFQGQMLVSLLKDSKTAQSLGGLLVSCTSLFSGVLIPPQAIPTFWIFMYWILPGHWIMEGLFTSQYGSSQIPIEASLDSPFYVALGCNETDNSPCMGTAGEWLAVTFTSFSADNIKWDVTYLVVMIVISRAVSWVALTNLNYRST
ncbi:hypothetical protein MPSEU_000290000 [Mayamaea pseudoterrestris]|nr:hypothetical protein MPSEU_000290000 [Mayamaea pseudoterrestris]